MQVKQCKQCTCGLWGSVTSISDGVSFIWSLPGDLCFECGELDKVGSDEAGVLHQIWIVQVNTIWGKNVKPRISLVELRNRKVDSNIQFSGRDFMREKFSQVIVKLWWSKIMEKTGLYYQIRAMVEMIMLLGWWYDHDNNEIRITMFSG